jgi:hypothetical protein
VVYAATPGKAKHKRLLELRDGWDDIEYTGMRCKRLAGFASNETDEDFARVAEYRGIPFARLGMFVEVSGKRGIIVGHNSSSNLDVLFENGSVLNCHPWSRVKYFDEDGDVIKEFPDL